MFVSARVCTPTARKVTATTTIVEESCFFFLLLLYYLSAVPLLQSPESHVAPLCASFLLLPPLISPTKGPPLADKPEVAWRRKRERERKKFLSSPPCSRSWIPPQYHHRHSAERGANPARKNSWISELIHLNLTGKKKEVKIKAKNKNTRECSP